MVQTRCAAESKVGFCNLCPALPRGLNPMPMKHPLPTELEPVRAAAMRALGPVKPAGAGTQADKDFLFSAKRTDAGRSLPPYFLVYFLLVDLLGFRDLGRFEKISWSVPIDYHGQAFLIEHRKFGIGVFAHDPEHEEGVVREIVIRVHKAVKAARPFFDWLADQAVQNSQVNVVNNSSALFDRLKYFQDAYRGKVQETTNREKEGAVREHETRKSSELAAFLLPGIRFNLEARWLALATIESFFSWTEHVFIHLSILSGRLKTASEVTALAESDWPDKFKKTFDFSEPKAKHHFDQLMALRRELRNFVAHGAFGKQREAFRFHSSAGAVPVLLPHRVGSRRFTLGEGLAFDPATALLVIEDFISFLWTGSRAQAEIYIQQSGLPVILTLAADGTYSNAMESSKSMAELVKQLSHQFDQAANMDW